MDPNPAVDINMDSFDTETKAKLSKFLETENAKARFQQSIHTFTSLCWDKCISKNPISASGKLDRSEESCVAFCVDRFMDCSMYIVNQLQEAQSQGRI